MATEAALSIKIILLVSEPALLNSHSNKAAEHLLSLTRGCHHQKVREGRLELYNKKVFKIFIQN